MANWVYLWLQKQHLHGIGSAETIRYLLEGPAARSETSKKILSLEAAITNRRASLEWQPSVRLPHVEERYLQQSMTASVALMNLVNEIYDIDEQIELLATNSGQSAGEIQAAILVVQKRIQEIEDSNDESHENSTVLWCSQAFSEAAVDSPTFRMSTRNACSYLESSGYTVRRSGDIEETLQIARELMQTRQLRCVIIGGDESPKGCGNSCIMKHTGNCLHCRLTFENHSGHDCPSGGRGSWLVNTAGSATCASLENNFKLIQKLQDGESSWAQLHGTIPTDRIAVYTVHTTLTEGDHMEYWRLGVTSFEYYFHVKDWVNAILPWKSVEEAKQVSDSKLDEEVKLEELAKSKAELEQLERRRLSTENSLDGSSKALHLKACEKYEELSGFVRHTLTKLQAAEIEFSRLMDINMTSATVNTSNLDVSRFCGPESGRDSSYALAWLEVYHNDPSSFAPLVDMLGELRKHHSSIVMEIYSLRRMELAAKVVCHVTSPHQKKLLNLSYNWLNTFLPHCLAKVNRVSFGLLSLEDCEAAIKADPMVPRSRLKLAVPFVGKDVPSSASEFAHPDIIIGLSILAYRYSGLRDDDYKDVIDRLTAQFSNEIGPARDRASSLRHEKWVWAAGGRIRGLNSTRDGLPWIEHGGISEEQSEKEVVQLKFLQKSNNDQMDRLYNLIKLEPSVVHHYLQSMIFPQYMRSQREKISASGQTVGGDMLVMKRVGFSGTPSDLLPQELGRCDYETGKLNAICM